MQTMFAENALLNNGWAQNVVIKISDDGVIDGIDIDQSRPANATLVADPLLPGMPNLHSHAHQRAMAGQSEYQASAAGEHDSFWTWRVVMHRFAELLTPEILEVVATQLYVEMLEAGYTSVCEFHYVHHDLDGKTYSDVSAMAQSIIRAARTAGIGLTLLPVLYSQGGYNGKPANEGQKRFISDPDDLLDIIGEAQKILSESPGNTIGLALHSPRQISLTSAQAVVDELDRISPYAPIHIHVAEQEKDVTESLEVTGLRPVDWTFENFDVTDHWTMIHATHLIDEEITRLAASGAVAGVCPTTEANLGDGLFPLGRFLADNGVIGIGSDSHVSVSWVEELRLLEYGQRLVKRRRNVSAKGPGSSTGLRLFDEVIRGGAQATGRPVNGIAVGQRADFQTLDADAAIFCGVPIERTIDTAVFSGNRPVVKDVWVGGKKVVINGAHIRRAESLANYASMMKRLPI